MPIASEPTSTLSPRSVRRPTAGSTATTFSAAHLAARAWFRERADAAGLETRIDGAANHSAVLPARDPAARTLLLGSHLDSVRRGGRFDGALGVVCALEVLRAVQDAGLELPVTLEAVDFTDEEGTLIGTLGSLALAGIADAARSSLRRAAAASSSSRSSRAWGSPRKACSAARRDPASLAGYLELHIEQGPVLERAGIDIGIVTGIVGSARSRVVFEGEARHAGTTPMDARRDAAVGAAAFVLGVTGDWSSATSPGASPRSVTSDRAGVVQRRAGTRDGFASSAARSTRGELDALERALTELRRRTAGGACGSAE